VCTFFGGSYWGCGPESCQRSNRDEAKHQRDKAEGKFHEMKGTVKDKAGQLTNNPSLEAEGTVENATGKIQGIIGQVEKALQK
jgi:uncharacterized protein YjbJ (UPF0337 family)